MSLVGEGIRLVLQGGQRSSVPKYVISDKSVRAEEQVCIVRLDAVTLGQESNASNKR
jgi:hypothetical protein